MIAVIRYSEWLILDKENKYPVWEVLHDPTRSSGGGRVVSQDEALRLIRVHGLVKQETGYGGRPVRGGVFYDTPDRQFLNKWSRGSDDEDGSYVNSMKALIRRMQPGDTRKVAIREITLKGYLNKLYNEGMIFSYSRLSENGFSVTRVR